MGKTLEQQLILQHDDIPFVEYGETDERLPLVLLNGISMPPTHWGELPIELDRKIYAIGLSEERESSWFPTYSSYADKLKPVIHEIAGQYYDLLGLSWGGLLAQQIAIRDGGVRRMVLAGTPPATPLAFVALPDLEAVKIVMSSDRTPDNTKRLYGGDFCDDPSLLGELGALIERPIDMVEHHRQLCAGTLGSLLLAERAMYSFFGGHVPETMILAGDNDPLVPYRGVQLGAAALGMKLHIVEGGGHGFLFTRPKEMAAVINEFLDI